MSEVAPVSVQRRLGRGLSALLGGSAPAYEETQRTVPSELREIAVQQITRNPFQPRKHFDPESLGELAASIKEHGILQPVLVRELDNGFQLIAGERRWQAAQKAGLATIPCRIVDVIDKTACEFALEENLKRKDLNDLEKAQAFREYLDHFQCTIEELAKQLSMNRSTVNNMLRLLDLSDPVKNALHSGRVTAGHARALLSLPEAQQLELCGRIQAEQLSVRQTEAAVKTLLGRDTPAVEVPAAEASTPETAPLEATAAESTNEQHGEVAGPIVLTEGAAEGDDSGPSTLPMGEVDEGRTNHVRSLEQQLRDLLGVPAQIKLHGRDSGEIVVPFSSNDEFERILNSLRRAAA